MVSRIDVSGIHYEVPADIKKFVLKKVGRLDRVVPSHARKSMHIEVTLTELKTKANRNQCEILIHLPEKQITAKESEATMFAAVDAAEAKARAQLRKYKASHGGDKQDHHSRLRRLLRRRPPVEEETFI